MQGEQPKAFASIFVLAAAPAAPIKFAATATTTIKPVELRNVVGVLPGQANHPPQVHGDIPSTEEINPLDRFGIPPAMRELVMDAGRASRRG